MTTSLPGNPQAAAEALLKGLAYAIGTDKNNGRLEIAPSRVGAAEAAGTAATAFLLTQTNAHLADIAASLRVLAGRTGEAEETRPAHVSATQEGTQ